MLMPHIIPSVAVKIYAFDDVALLGGIGGALVCGGVWCVARAVRRNKN